jgi:hypothetical protein
VAHQIHELEKTEHSEEDVVHLRSHPAWCGVVGVDKEIVAAEAHQEPVMSTIFEYVEDWHRFV